MALHGRRLHNHLCPCRFHRDQRFKVKLMLMSMKMKMKMCHSPQFWKQNLGLWPPVHILSMCLTILCSSEAILLRCHSPPDPSSSQRAIGQYLLLQRHRSLLASIPQSKHHGQAPPFPSTEAVAWV